MKVKYLIMVGAAMAMGSLFAESGVSYQGRLVDEYDKPSTNRQQIAFAVYGEPTGGTLLWQKVQYVEPNSNGTFNVELFGVGKDANGNNTSTLSEVLSSDDPRYLQLGFLGEDMTVVATVTPRQKLQPVPSAIYAQNVSMARGNFIVRGNATFYGDVTINGEQNKSANDSDMEFSKNQLSVANLSIDRNIHVTGDGTNDNDLAIKGGLTIRGNVTLEADAKSRAFTATHTDFTVKALDIVGGGLTVNGLNPDVPIGAISIWSGGINTVPDGWAICDGGKYEGVQTPNLTGRFVIGAGTTHGKKTTADGGQEYAVKATGGKRTVALTTAEMPSHTHQIFGDDQLEYWMTRVEDQRCYDADSERSGGSGWYRTTKTGGNSSGGTEPHENLPPYMALFYVMKVK